jgi:hypothetical protein
LQNKLTTSTMDDSIKIDEENIEDGLDRYIKVSFLLLWIRTFLEQVLLPSYNILACKLKERENLLREALCRVGARKGNHGQGRRRLTEPADRYTQRIRGAAL